MSIGVIGIDSRAGVLFEEWTRRLEITIQFLRLDVVLAIGGRGCRPRLLTALMNLDCTVNNSRRYIGELEKLLEIGDNLVSRTESLLDLLRDRESAGYELEGVDLDTKGIDLVLSERYWCLW